MSVNKAVSAVLDSEIRGETEAILFSLIFCRGSYRICGAFLVFIGNRLFLFFVPQCIHIQS